VAVEGIGQRIDGFITHEGDELADAEFQAVADGHADVHVSLRNIELPLGLQVGDGQVIDRPADGAVVIGGVRAVVAQAGGVDAGGIRAVHEFDHSADVELGDIDLAFKAQDELIEHVVIAIFMVERPRDDDRAVLAAAALAVVIGVAAFDPAVDVELEVLDGLAGAGLVQAHHEQPLGGGGIGGQNFGVQGQRSFGG